MPPIAKRLTATGVQISALERANSEVSRWLSCSNTLGPPRLVLVLRLHLSGRAEPRPKLDMLQWAASVAGKAAALG
jgi:hypothetical protein